MEEEKQQSYYVVIPTYFWDNEELPWKIKKLYGRIVSLCKKEGYCFASNSYLASEIKTSERTIRRYLSKLKELKMIECELNDEGNERRIYLWRIMGKTSGGEDKDVLGGGQNKGSFVQGGGQVQGENVHHSNEYNSDLNKEDDFKNKKRYDGMKTILKNKSSISYKDRTEVDEEVAMLQRTGLLKRPNKEEIRALKLEQENWKNANL